MTKIELKARIAAFIMNYGLPGIDFIENIPDEPACIGIVTEDGSCFIVEVKDA